ncbi:MAG: hypothetical protein WBO16_00405, partial [Gammaproteobacteria bacterium]
MMTVQRVISKSGAGFPRSILMSLIGGFCSRFTRSGQLFADKFTTANLFANVITNSQKRRINH